MTEEPPPIPRIRAVTGVFVETGIVMHSFLFFVPAALLMPDVMGMRHDTDLGEWTMAMLGIAVVVFVLTLMVARVVVGRAGAGPTGRWVAWECLRYAIIGLGLGLFMSVAFTRTWFTVSGVAAVLLAVGLVVLATVGVGRLRRWRDRVHREQLLDRLIGGLVVVEGVVIDSRSSGRMTDMTTIGWRDSSGTARYARVITSGVWTRLAPVSLIMRADDQARVVHASQQIG